MKKENKEFKVVLSVLNHSRKKRFFFFIWKYASETQQYFPTLVDGRGGKPPAILAEGLTPKDSRLEPVTSPRTKRVCARLTN